MAGERKVGDKVRRYMAPSDRDVGGVRGEVLELVDGGKMRIKWEDGEEDVHEMTHPQILVDSNPAT